MIRTVRLLLAAAVIAAASPALARDVLGTIQDAGAFSLLLQAVKAAGLTETLSGPGPITLFAPTDDAFGKIPRATLESLFKPEGKQKLKEILTYHVVAGAVLSRDVAGKRLEAQTVQGGAVLIDATRSLTVDGAKITRPDMRADNGVVHVIDTVLMPK
jgi:uncharacterized surface protein with fasciclin (FAS1) repeats